MVKNLCVVSISFVVCYHAHEPVKILTGKLLFTFL